MHTDPRLLALADRCHAEVNREQARWLPPFAIEESADVLMTASGTRFPAFNAVLALGPAPGDPERLLDAARAYYAARRRGFAVHVRAHADAELERACERAGFVRVSDPPGMVLTERGDPPAERPSSRIVTVEGPGGGEHARAFVEVTAAAYESVGLPPPVTRKVFSYPERWLEPQWHVEVVYEGERPVAGAMVLFCSSIAGVYWVGTVPDARGRGHAAAVMRSIGRRAFDRGARAVVLQASAFGEPMYRRLGYREITRYPWYLVPAGG